MSSKFEKIATALEALLNCIGGPNVKRNEEIPEQIPDLGLIILNDGREADFEEVLGGFDETYHRHEFEIEGFVQSGRVSTRNQRFDDLFVAIGQQLKSDETLGGLIFGMSYTRPEVSIERQQGTAAIKGGFLSLFVEYSNTTPLG